MLARHADGSTDTLESDFEQVCQPAAPQEAQLWYKKVGNRSFMHNVHKDHLPTIDKLMSPPSSPFQER